MNSNLHINMQSRTNIVKLLTLAFFLALFIPNVSSQGDVLDKIKGVFGEITISGEPNFIPPSSFEIIEGDVRYKFMNFEGMKNAIFLLREGKLQARFDEATLITIKDKVYPLLNRTEEEKATFLINLQKQEIERAFFKAMEANTYRFSYADKIFTINAEKNGIVDFDPKDRITGNNVKLDFLSKGAPSTINGNYEAFFDEGGNLQKVYLVEGSLEHPQGASRNIIVRADKPTWVSFDNPLDVENSVFFDSTPSSEKIYIEGEGFSLDFRENNLFAHINPDENDRLIISPQIGEATIRRRISISEEMTDVSVLEYEGKMKVINGATEIVLENGNLNLAHLDVEHFFEEEHGAVPLELEHHDEEHEGWTVEDIRNAGREFTEVHAEKSGEHEAGEEGRGEKGEQGGEEEEHEEEGLTNPDLLKSLAKEDITHEISELSENFILNRLKDGGIVIPEGLLEGDLRLFYEGRNSVELNLQDLKPELGHFIWHGNLEYNPSLELKMPAGQGNLFSNYGGNGLSIGFNNGKLLVECRNFQEIIIACKNENFGFFSSLSREKGITLSFFKLLGG